MRNESQADRRCTELAADNQRLRLEVEELRQAELVHQQALDRQTHISSAWRATLDALTDPVFLVARDGRILRANRAIELWQLGSVREVAGCPLHRILHPRCDDPRCYLVSLVERFLWAADGGSKASVHEVDDRVLGRRVRWTAHRVELEHGPDSGEPGALFVLRDVTEAQLRMRLLSHRDRFQTMERLLRGLAHELGNPLAALKTSAQVLERNFDRFDRDKQGLYLERILEGADRIQDILSEVLEHHQRQLGPLEPVPLTPLLDHLRTVFADPMHERDIEYRVSPPAGPELALTGDLAAVQTVLDAVLRNALEACEAHDGVFVGATSNNGGSGGGGSGGDASVRIEIRDTGSGIRRADLEQVFQPFFSTKQRHLGLGLTYVDQLMDRMDGSVEIDSTEGEGTSVVLVFTPAAGLPG